MNNLIKAFML
jgi:malate dehydrogenase (oxaloacetate-decarboxylating)(NADP+)